MGGRKTSTLLVNKTEKVIDFYVESSVDNFQFKKTLGPGETCEQQFDPNSTYSALRMFHNKAPTDITVSSDDMIDSRVITITLSPEGQFLLNLANAQSGETKTKNAGSSKSIWNRVWNRVWSPFG